MSRTPSAVRKAVASLEKVEAEILRQLSHVRDTIDRLEQLTAPGRPRRRKGAKNERRLSAKGREAISRAAKRRWAAYRKEQRQAR